MTKTPVQAVEAGGRGFSLIELMIAMVVTLVVSGAVLTLLVQANRSFQTQPEMTERQQNIRAAMDLIMRDIANAGAGLPQQVQVFTTGRNNVGPASPVGTAADPRSDELEMLTNDTGRDPLPVCAASAGATVQIQPINPGVTLPASVLLLMSVPLGTYSGPFTVTGVEGAGAPCGTTLTIGGAVPVGSTVSQVVFLNRVRYYIAPDPDDPAMPVLWREMNGVGPGQQVARGIENMQVTYRSAADIVANPTACANADCDIEPRQPVDVVAAPGLDSLTVEVQVVLSARGGLLVPAGQPATAVALTAAADGTSAYRGNLRSSAAPRAALVLASGDGRWQ